jgi:hypothetical protein
MPAGRPAAPTLATPPWPMPARLVAACLDRLEVGAEDGLAALVEAVSVGVLAGSIAKSDALAGGEVPPGADPVAVAERWLADPGLSWSCWATCTLLAALAQASGHRAAVVAGRRIDEAAAPVDFHSFVVVGDDRGRWVCDPYFGVGLMCADDVGRFGRPGVQAECAPDGHGWSLAVRTAQWSATCRYRTVTVPLDAGDVEAFCRVSTTHTGVGPSRYALRLLADGVAMAREGGDGGAVLRRWRPGPDGVRGAGPEASSHAALTDAVAALRALDDRSTGRRPVGQR